MSLAQLIPTDPLSRLRLSVMLLIAAVVAPALFRLGCIKGLVRTIRVDGGSMAETLYGNHFRVTCGDCGITFRCDADAFPDDRRAVCPNCGYRDNELRDEDLRRGDRVLVDTWPYLWSAPRRGDMVMLIDPLPPDTTASPFAVKRIVALPLERPGIRSGDLLADGKVETRRNRCGHKRSGRTCQDPTTREAGEGTGRGGQGHYPRSGASETHRRKLTFRCRMVSAALYGRCWR